MSTIKRRPPAPAARARPERLSFVQWLCRALPPILSYRLATRILRNRSAPGETLVTRTITGGLFSFHSGDLLGDQVRMCGFWDWRAQAIAAIFCDPGDTIVEVGANTGTETVGFAQIVRPEGRVIAFEPLPKIADALRYNAQINGFDHIETIEAAVTDFNGTLYIQPPSSPTNSGQGYITETPDNSSVCVPAVTLDSMIDELGPAKLIQIDVEGHEIAVLRGAGQYIRRYYPALLVEAVAEQAKRAGSSLKQLAQQLTSIGYTVFQINRISVTRPDLERCDEHYHRNWLCIPNARRFLKNRVNMYLTACAFVPRALYLLTNPRSARRPTPATHARG